MVDALLAEVSSDHVELRIWKEAVLSTNEVTGFADYIIAPRRDFLKQPILCVVDAKKGDFTQGTAQCLMEMYACTWNNRSMSMVS